MKKRFATIILATLLGVGSFGVLHPQTVAAAGNVLVRVNGLPLETDVPAQIDSGRTLVPLRACAEALLAEVGYDAVTKEVQIQQGSNLILLQIGSDVGYLDGEAFLLDVPAKVINGRTMVPIRVISEAFGATVGWDQQAQIVDISLQGSDLGEITGIDSVEQELLALVNAARANEGLEPVVWSEPLCQMARTHTTDMVTNEFFGHQSLSRGDTAARAAAAKLPPTSENIASGYSSADMIYSMWIKSSEARANILNPLARFMGAGVLQDRDGNYVATAEFINMSTFMVMDRSSANYAGEAPQQVTGYTTDTRVTGTLYLLSPFAVNQYTSSTPVSAEVSNQQFQMDLGYLSPGLYSLQLGSDVVFFRHS